MQRRKKNAPGVKRILHYLKQPVIWAVILLSLFFYKSFFIYAILICLDFLKIYIKVNSKLEFPLDFGLFLAVIAGYIGRPELSFFIVPMLVLNRLFLGLVKPTFIIKFPLLILFSYAADLFSYTDLAILGAAIILIRYIAEYALELLIFRSVTTERLHWRALHIVMGYFFYLTLGKFIIYLLGI